MYFCTAILLSNDCCDPWYRQSVRVSMGHIFKKPIVRVTSLSETLHALQHTYGVQVYGAVIDENAQKLKNIAIQSGQHNRWCGIVGSEDKGISKEVRAVCENKDKTIGGLIRIDMSENVDSMSITVAAGIFLHGLRRLEMD